jgi:muramoyltetrapeptide carboxypeptidase
MLRGVVGLAFGQFARCTPEAGRPSRRLGEILREHALAIGTPAVAGVPAGHGPGARVLPLGFTADLDADRGVLRLTPPAAR